MIRRPSFAEVLGIVLFLMFFAAVVVGAWLTHP
jgi:hypothetical protein